MKLQDVKKLADLARINMSDEEMESIAHDFDAILAYVDQVKEVSKLNKIEALHENSDNYYLQNVIRDDVITNNSGEYNKKIISQMPDTKDGFLKVKQIL